MQEEVFVIATNRKDGALPSAAKVVNYEFYGTTEEALAQLRNYDQVYYGVYRVLVEVTNKVELAYGKE